MQSFTKAGDFTFWFKLRSALIDNAIYYGSYLLIVGVLLLYIALRPDVHLDSSKLRTIAATASNTWGLFWLVLLLGYGLVEVPRSIWHSSSTHHTINHAYFNTAKLFHERGEAEDHLNDILQSIKALKDSMSPTHPLRDRMDIIESKIPSELLDKMRNNHVESPQSDVASEKALVKIHKQLLKALQHFRRVETQWSLLVTKIENLEDLHKSSVSVEKQFIHSRGNKRPKWFGKIYTPKIEWYIKCIIRKYALKTLSVICAIVSLSVVWSELTFFVKEPPLTLFANIIRLAQINSDYFTLEVISSLSMAYIAFCAYSTLFKVRVLNLYYLAPHHLTDEYSLIFCGMMLSRLTPPMCLNFLSLIHMDSHIIDKQTHETYYTQIMGHMDVIPIISDGFNVYFPMMIVALCLATYYKLGSRILSAIGFQQFVGEDELTTELIEEGRTIAGRELRKRHRDEENFQRRLESSQRFSSREAASSIYRSRDSDINTPGFENATSESNRTQLLNENSPNHRIDSGMYSESRVVDSESQVVDLQSRMRSYNQYDAISRPRTFGRPDRGLFDDV